MKRMAIYHPEGNYTNNPHLSAFFAALLKEDWKIDYFSHLSHSSPKSPDLEGLNLFVVPLGIALSTIISHYNYAIGIDNGILDAENTAKNLNIPYAFFSYEIFFDDELPRDLRQLKIALKHCCKNIQFVCVQDKTRGALLAKEYAISSENVIYSPVAGENIIPYQKSSYLYDKCSIPEQKKILLYMGSMASWAKTAWLVEGAKTLPADWVLVLHGRYGLEEDFVKNFSTNEKIFFSTQPTETQEQLKLLVQSANCTVALYEADYANMYTGKNIANIGLSSGKFSVALQHGVPVIVNTACIEMAEIILKEQCGFIIDTKQKCNLSFLQNIKLPEHSCCHNAFIKYLDFSLSKNNLLAIVNNTYHKNTILKNENETKYLALNLMEMQKKQLLRLCYTSLQTIIKRFILKFIKR